MNKETKVTIRQGNVLGASNISIKMSRISISYLTGRL